MKKFSVLIEIVEAAIIKLSVPNVGFSDVRPFHFLVDFLRVLDWTIYFFENANLAADSTELSQ